MMLVELHPWRADAIAALNRALTKADKRVPGKEKLNQESFLWKFNETSSSNYVARNFKWPFQEQNFFSHWGDPNSSNFKVAELQRSQNYGKYHLQLIGKISSAYSDSNG